MTYLNDLLARVNSASGPDRELDARIHVALFPDEKGMVHPGSPDGLRGSSHGPVCGMDWTAWAKLEAARRGDPLLADHHSWPEYSASLDAALALVERVLPGAWIDLNGPRKYLNIPTPSPNRWRADCASVGWGATPALALIAALLSGLGPTSETKGLEQQ